MARFGHWRGPVANCLEFDLSAIFRASSTSIPKYRTVLLQLRMTEEKLDVV
jgi:hypothetical protein